MMRKVKFFSLFVLLALLIGTGLATTMAQEPPLNPSGSDGPFSEAEVKAAKLWDEAMRPENADRREALLSRVVELYTEVLLEEPPHKASVYVNRGATYSQLRQYNQAITDYNAALSMLPGSVSADIIKNRGLAYERQGKLHKALADFETFLNLIADAPSERRADERVRFAAKVEALRSKLGESGGQSVSPPKAGQRTLERAPEPNYWVWGEWLGNAKAHNDTIGDTTYPNRPGWACELWHGVDKVENAVWFQLPGVTASRTAYYYNVQLGGWLELSWDHYYASQTGWTPLSPNNYYLQVPNSAVCTGYTILANYHKIRGQFWVN